LDVGKMYWTGAHWKVSLFHGTDTRLDPVDAAVEQWALGYWTCTGSDVDSTLTLAVGTNTSAGTVSYHAGKAMAVMVNTIQSWVEAHVAQVDIMGGNDIEMDWAGPSDVRNWVQGFDDNIIHGSYYVNY